MLCWGVRYTAEVKSSNGRVSFNRTVMDGWRGNRSGYAVGCKVLAAYLFTFSIHPAGIFSASRAGVHQRSDDRAAYRVPVNTNGWSNFVAGNANPSPSFSQGVRSTFPLMT